MEKGNWILKDASGRPVIPGQEYKDFRGETDVIIDGTPPHKPGANGYVYTQEHHRYYAGVFGLVWVKKGEINDTRS